MEENNKLKESQEQNNKNKNQESIKIRFIKEFSKTFLVGNEKNQFIEEVMNNDSIDNSTFLKSKLAIFKASTGDEELKNFDESKINIYDLRAEVAKEYTQLNNVRDTYLSYLDDNYDLSSRDLNKLRKSNAFTNLIVEKLEELLRNEKKNLDFVSSILNKKVKSKYDINIFDTLTDKELQKRLEKIGKNSPDIAHNLKLALLRISQGQTNGEDFRFLFNSGVLTLEEKKQLLKKFIPFLSLQEAKNYGLLTSQEVEKYKEKIVESYLESQENLTEEQVKKLKEVLPLGAIIIPSKELFKNVSEINLNEIVKDFDFIGVSYSVNEAFNDAKHEIEKDSNIDLFKKLGLDIEKIQKGNILELEVPEKNEKGENTNFFETFYFEIKDFDDNKITLKDIGKNNDIHFQGETKAFYYKHLFDYISKNNVKASLVTRKDFKKNISDENSDFNVESNFEKINDFNSLSEDEKFLAKQELLNSYKKQKEELEKELKDLESGLGEYAGLDSDEKEKKRKLLEAKISNLDKIIVKIQNGELDSDELTAEYNFVKFLDSLNLIDKQGKELGFKKGIFIETGKGLFDSKDEGGGAYEVVDLDKESGIITLNSIAGKERVDFGNFLRILKKEKGKRTKKILNFEEIINSKLNENHWKNIKLKDGKIIDKDAEYSGEKKDREVKFLVGDKTDKVVKINEINGDRVKAQFGTIKDLNEEEKKEKKYKKEDDVHELKLGDEIDISLNELNKYINDFELYPDWKIGQKSLAKEAPKDLQNDIKGHLSTRIFNRYSISELVAGAKLMVSGIEEYFKKGNDIHAAKFALGLGQILPEEVRADLKIKVEREEAEAMDKAIESLGKVDSPIATNRIKEWLLNKDTPEYKKEAGLMFMLQKYGVLYAKKLTEYQGKFLWYEAFGGRIGDELYNSVKEEAERNNVPFSEEKLMHMLLKKQCKGLLKPERRSRLHKDYEGKWKTGVKEEFEKGYDDASKKRNATEMVKGGMDEAFGGTIPNAIGWFKKAVERGDSLEVMSEGFFSLMYSGVLGEQDENLLVKLKDLWDGDGLPIIMIRFASNKGDLDFFNRTVLELSKRIAEVDKENFPNIYSDAKDVFKKAMSGEGTEKERLEEAQKFWKKYSSVLTRALYFQDIGHSDTSKTDKIILLEKDKNPIFKKYYDTVRAFTDIGGAFNKELMDDEPGEHGVAGLNTKKIVEKFFILDSSRNIRADNVAVVRRIWKNIAEDINSVKDKNMEINGGDDIQNKRNYLKIKLRDLFAGFRSLNSEPLFIKKYVEGEPFSYDMKNWGVTVDTIQKFIKYSAGEIEAGAKGSDEIIDAIIDNILNGGGIVSNKNEVFEEIEEQTKEAVNNVTHENR